jgi:hypothetical protein
MLERARAPGEAPPGPSRDGTARRFSGVRPTVPTPDAPPPAPPVDRFAPPPQASGPVDLGDAGDERPSTRCLECGAENGRFAPRCTGCGAALATRAVVRLNRRLWGEERRQRDAARSERRERDAAAHAEATLQAVQRRAEAKLVVDEAFDRILAEERARQRPPIARLADRLALGPLAAWSTGARVGLIVAAVLLAIVALHQVPGRGVIAVQLVLASLLLAGLPSRRR